ncbi:hypothetical protein [Candidatus Nanohalobium constans]|uniref:Uncharacterized protein n=1 Tax=Candidatus Nanohalobium constans TaxID=2565781 RepID=A0A5Q0UFM4_9ARCH|nr:hypothetical protein [Candidatus Nanohalobium constans]QGA80387.1 hypothetical protein LC1Nh_0487 [Candidatus Nanohalobium constans]
MIPKNPLSGNEDNGESSYTNINIDRRTMVAVGALAAASGISVYLGGRRQDDSDGLPGSKDPMDLNSSKPKTAADETGSVGTSRDDGLVLNYDSGSLEEYFFGSISDNDHVDDVQEHFFESGHETVLESSEYIDSGSEALSAQEAYETIHDGFFDETYLDEDGTSLDEGAISDAFSGEINITDLLVDNEQHHSSSNSRTEFYRALSSVSEDEARDTAETLKDLETASEWYDNNVSTETSTSSEYEPDFEFGKFIDIYDDVVQNGQTEQLMNRVQEENIEAFQIVEQAYDVGLAYENSDQSIQDGDHTVQDGSRYILAGVLNKDQEISETEVEWMNHRTDNKSSFELPDNPYEDDWSGDGVDNDTIIGLGRGPNEQNYNMNPMRSYGAFNEDDNLKDISISDEGKVKIKRRSDINDRTLTTTLDFKDWKNHRDGAFKTANKLIEDSDSHYHLRNPLFNENSLGRRVEKILTGSREDVFEDLVVDMHNLATMFPENNSKVQKIAEKAFNDRLEDRKEKFNILESSTAIYNIAHEYMTEDSSEFKDRDLNEEAFDYLEAAAAPVKELGITRENFIDNLAPIDEIKEEQFSDIMEYLEKRGKPFDKMPTEVINQEIGSTISSSSNDDDEDDDSGGGDNGGLQGGEDRGGGVQ